jgi:hypothetical protein
MFATALFAAALLAQPGVLHGAPAQPAPDSTAEITVYGHIIRDAPTLVERFGRPTSGDRLARWREPVCVGVDGLDPQHDRWLAARIGDIAENVGAPVGPSGCTANIVVLVAQQDLALRQRIGQRAYRYLNAAARPVDKTQLAAFVRADGAPAHLFYATGTAVGATGVSLASGYSNTAQFGLNQSLGAPVVQGQASRLIPIAEPSLARVVLVLDGGRLEGKSLEQVAAYAALVTLAEVRIDPPLREPASIAALFTDASPDDLTVWDRAYLKGLYSSGSQINLSMQQSVLADRLTQVVRAIAKRPSAPLAGP